MKIYFKDNNEDDWKDASGIMFSPTFTVSEELAYGKITEDYLIAQGKSFIIMGDELIWNNEEDWLEL